MSRVRVLLQVGATLPPQHSRVRTMSYNLLADNLAHEHSRELYNSSPRFALEWGYRRKLILREICEYLPDVLCLQGGVLCSDSCMCLHMLG